MSDYAGSLMFNTKLDTNGFQSGTKKIGDQSGKITETVTKWAKRGAMAIGTAITGAMVSGVKYNAQMEQYYQSFKTMLGSTEKATQHMKMLKKFAAETPFEMSDLAKASQTLLAFGEDASNVKGDLKMLGDISLGNKEKFSALALVFGQVKSQGKLMGQDLLQMINAGFNPLQIISKKTGQSVSELKDEMAKGNITFDMVSDAMKTATSAGGQFNDAMKTQSKTAAGLWSTLKDNVHEKLGESMEGVSNIIKTDLLPSAIEFVDKFNVKKITSDAKKLVTVLKVVAPLMAGIYVTPKISSGIGGISTIWKSGVKEAMKYRIEMNAISRLSLTGTKAEISAVGAAVGLLSGNLSIAEAKQAALNSLQKGMAAINPYVAATVGVLALCAGLNALDKAYTKHLVTYDKSTASITKLAKANEEASKSYDKEKASAMKSMEQKGAEIVSNQTLKSELDDIVDKNGKVKKGYEDRARVITSELSKATGIEISMQNGVIQNYAKLSTAIDNYLIKKQAETVLDSMEGPYKTAMANIQKVLDQYTKASAALKNHTKSRKEQMSMTEDEYQQYQKEQKKLVKAKADAAAQYKKYNDNITQYESALAAVLKGDYSKINEIMSGHAKAMDQINTDLNNKDKKALQDRKKNTQGELDALNEFYKTHKDKRVKDAIEAKEAELKATDEALAGMSLKPKKKKKDIKDSTKDAMKGAAEGIAETDIKTPWEKKFGDLNSEPGKHKGTLKAAITSLFGGAKEGVASTDLAGPFNSKLALVDSQPGKHRPNLLSSICGLMNAGKGGVSSTNLSSAINPRLNELTAQPSRHRGGLMSQMRSLMSSGRSAAGGISFSSIGSAAVSGIIRGVANNAGRLYSTFRNLASKALKAAKKAIDSNSPSKKFEKEVGLSSIQGWVLGVSKNAHMLYSKMREVADNSISVIPKSAMTIGVGFSTAGLTMPRMAAGTEIPVQAVTSLKVRAEEQSIISKLADKVEAISARDIKQEINFNERIYTPADARDTLAELGRLGLEVDK